MLLRLRLRSPKLGCLSYVSADISSGNQSQNTCIRSLFVVWLEVFRALTHMPVDSSDLRLHLWAAEAIFLLHDLLKQVANSIASHYNCMSTVEMFLRNPCLIDLGL